MADIDHQLTDEMHHSNQENANKKVIRSKYGAQATTSQTDKCKKCDRRVYDMEKIAAGPVIYHKSCFRCTHCNRILSIGSYTVGDNKLYCQPHYISLFKEKGKYEFGVEKTNESHEPSYERRRLSRDAKLDSVDSAAAVMTRRHEETDQVLDRKPLPVRQPTEDRGTSEGEDKRRFSAIASRRAMFESPSSPASTKSSSTPRKSQYNDITIPQESVKMRMAKYTALQAEKAAAAGAKTSSAAMALPKKQESVNEGVELVATRQHDEDGQEVKEKYMNGEGDSNYSKHATQRELHEQNRDEGEEKVQQDNYHAVRYADNNSDENTDINHDKEQQQQHETYVDYHDDSGTSNPDTQRAELSDNENREVVECDDHHQERYDSEKEEGHSSPAEERHYHEEEEYEEQERSE
jgi:hypothetical protein